MRTAATIVTLSLLSLSAGAAEVYRSVDAQGNVVYSDRPGDRSAVRVAIATSAARAPVTAMRQPQAAAPAGEPDAATIAAAERAQLAEERAANCEIARERSETAATSHRLYRLDDNGQRVYYSDSELAQARVDAAAAVERWCN